MKGWRASFTLKILMKKVATRWWRQSHTRKGINANHNQRHPVTANGKYNNNKMS